MVSCFWTDMASQSTNMAPEHPLQKLQPTVLLEVRAPKTRYLANNTAPYQKIKYPTQKQQRKQHLGVLLRGFPTLRFPNGMRGHSRTNLWIFLAETWDLCYMSNLGKVGFAIFLSYSQLNQEIELVWGIQSTFTGYLVFFNKSCHGPMDLVENNDWLDRNDNISPALMAHPRPRNKLW